MWTEIFYDPVFWIALFIFIFVVAYFRWCEQKEEREIQDEKETELLERIRTLEEKVKKKEK